MIEGNHRCSGGDNRGKISVEVIERANRGWDDRETAEIDSTTAVVVKEEELSSHF